ncbi:hypothetical protein [Haloechinothrix salitolerans]|uniref:DUF4878 domain-containing protein n=1 Tax=Haloechinothrix salitolerans TaxID=926830 RepID=A0ABW2C190_9PSEU
MTYPPQPPGPHGPHGQQGHPWQHGYPPPRPPGPPRSNKTGVIAGITLTLVLLAVAAVAITGFLAPGYFLDDTTSGGQVASAADQESEAPSVREQPPKPSPRPQRGVPAPADGGSAEDVAIVRELAEDVATAINTRDEDLAREVSCGDARVDFSDMPRDAHVEVLGDPVIDGDTATAPLEITIDGDTRTETMVASRKDGGWCAG